MKDSYPVEVADYMITAKIGNEPAFAWWVPYTMKKRQHIISKLKTKYWERTHKYGIKVPKSVKEALRIDQENGDSLWGEAIETEMKNVRIAFQLHDGNPKELIGYQEIKCHMVFDIK